MRTFMFEGDCFAADCVSCITRDGCNVFVNIYHQEGEYEYSFDDEESAKTKQAEAIRAWKAA